ncbi:hypothetical protein NQ317_016104 [Molorchus minor]|uniref:Cytohesin-1 n=1 Tax=Molorchus minor TaxID=1323400 RepID=A0ABQ9IUS0_9CUCU|nr:hypothetical protein NQ317_016104 [Molorchus minor]
MEALDSGEDGKNSNKSKMMSIGRKKFNMDPKKGIEFLIDKGLLQNTPESVAHFLHKGEGLNKTAIGDYLGEKNDFNEKVLQAFVELHDFTDLILVQALRQFLWSFRLPGEAQKIDRMMECFAKRYCECQGDNNIFENSDTCYVLSFAIIMLNTSLHNPSVKEKPSIEQFINMNRGINQGQDLPLRVIGVMTPFCFLAAVINSGASPSIKKLLHMYPVTKENRALGHSSVDGKGYKNRMVTRHVGKLNMLQPKKCLSSEMQLVPGSLTATYLIVPKAFHVEQFLHAPVEDYSGNINYLAVSPEDSTNLFGASVSRNLHTTTEMPTKILASSLQSSGNGLIINLQDDGNDLMHTFFNPDKEGWLWKQGGRYKSWKRRWFILNDNCLYYFEYTTDKEPRGIIPLENISIRECSDRQKQYCFELYASGGADFIKACKTDSEGKVVEGKHTVYRMSASSDEERKEWMKRLTQSISHNPFYDMLANRKRKAQLYAKN